MATGGAVRNAVIRIDSHTCAASLVAPRTKIVRFVFVSPDSDEMPSKNNEVVIML